MRSRARSTTRCAGSSSPPTSARARSSTEHQHASTKISEILVRRETIEKEEFLALLDGKSEEEVFGIEEGAKPELPAPPRAAPSAPSAKRPRTIPRPGLAGGTAEMRGDDGPSGPEPRLSWRSQRVGPLRFRHVVRAFRLMGIVNVTPDSFSDGGRFLDPGRGGRARAGAGRRRARTSSTSAANRRGPAPSR